MTAVAQVPGINLLPHRQAARRRRSQLLLWQLAGGAMLGLLLALAAGAWLQQQLDAQLRRQEGWRHATQQVNAVLVSGKRVQGETAALLLRQQAIANLQAQRHAWVRMLDVLAQAIHKAKSAKPADVRNALSSTKFTEGWAKAMTGGAVKFNESGLNTLAEPVMVQWQKNELVTVWPKSLAKGKAILR